MGFARRCRALAARLGHAALASILLGAAAPVLAAEAALPTFAELEAAGAVIGRIQVTVRDIFDTEDPREDHALFRLANRLHIQTRSGVIERALLFKRGERLSVRLLDETERLLRGKRYLYDVQFRVLAVQGGVVDIEVLTRDTWTLDLGASVGRAGGANSASLAIKEYNLLGTGLTLSAGRFRNVDRSGTEFEVTDPSVMGGRVAFGLGHASNSDGRRDSFTLGQPFYALDTRWSAGVSALRDDRIDPVYVAGQIDSQYRHRSEQAELYGGWSAGLVDGWVRRWTGGLRLQDERFAREPGLKPPAGLPADARLVTPFVRFELIEDRFERELNRNLIGRPEFFALGLQASVELGQASTRLGSTRNATLYAASVAKGFELDEDTTWLVGARLWGQWSEGRVRGQHQSLQTQLYRRQSPRWLFYAGLAADSILHPDPLDRLQLGGDNGLRGYPLRYQGGTRRALLTLEERFYTDLYLWRLFRVGGAAFIDVGRAWGGAEPPTAQAGWLGDAGLGLRIVSARSAFSNVLHVDLAMPFNPGSDVRRLQLIVKTRTTF
ncbi:MAG: hypothetical protein U1F56_01605 [Rubrivivax sp.]